jgi:hypothetical protein
MASCDSKRAMSGTRKMVRLVRLTTVISRGIAPTVPVGALPSSARLRASAVITNVAESTHRLRKLERSSPIAIASTALMA